MNKAKNLKLVEDTICLPFSEAPYQVFLVHFKDELPGHVIAVNCNTRHVHCSSVWVWRTHKVAFIQRSPSASLKVDWFNNQAYKETQYPWLSTCWDDFSLLPSSLPLDLLNINFPATQHPWRCTFASQHPYYCTPHSEPHCTPNTAPFCRPASLSMATTATLTWNLCASQHPYHWTSTPKILHLSASCQICHCTLKLFPLVTFTLCRNMLRGGEEEPSVCGLWTSFLPLLVPSPPPPVQPLEALHICSWGKAVAHIFRLRGSAKSV